MVARTVVNPNLSFASVAPREFRASGTFYRLVNPKTALPLASAILLLAGVGDALTTVEVTFTLVYTLPIGLVTWFRGPRYGLLFVAIAVAISGYVDFVVGPAKNHVTTALFNLIGEALLFALLGTILLALRRRLLVEAELRSTVLGALRHADRLTTLGRLTAGLAHELGTPLNVVAGRAELLATGRVPKESAPEHAKIIVEQVDRMTVILRGMLDIGRQGAVQTRETDLLELAEKSVTLLGPIAAKSGVTLTVSGESVSAPCDPFEIQQVVGNLVSNAIDASPEGGTIALTVRRSSEVVAGSIAPRDVVIVEVEDHGSGIAQEVLPKIFDPFFTTKDVGEGTGLGLAIAFGIVRDHGGELRVESELGRGSTFRIVLPLAG